MCTKNDQKMRKAGGKKCNAKVIHRPRISTICKNTQVYDVIGLLCNTVYLQHGGGN